MIFFIFSIIISFIIFAISLLAFFTIFLKARHAFRQMGVNNLVDEMKNIRNANEEISKSISGMTRLVEPNIIRDFPNFNKNELYATAERDLRNIFNSIENKNMEYLDELPLIGESIDLVIKDMKESNTIISYDNIKFHQFALKSYEKSNGTATIELSLSLEYDYSEIKSTKVIKNIKTQTRYNCKYIYIYDEKLFDKNQKSFGVHCPNCGANITTLGNKECAYCGSKVYDINLSAWQMSSYQEY